MGRKCTQCGLTVAAKWEFCPLCGMKMPVRQSQQVPQSLSWWERRTQGQKSYIALAALLATVGVAAAAAVAVVKVSGFDP